MKSFKAFKSYLQEHQSPVAYIDTSGTQDISIPEIRNELNRHISLLFRQSFVTVESAVQRLAKILALYSLNIPEIDSNDNKSDTLKLIVGHNNITWDEFSGEIKNTNPWILTFSYKLEDGLYKCSAEIN